MLEEQADSVLHEIYTRLNSTFITPLDPEDIQSLSSHLDDVIDGIEDSVHRMLDYHIDPMPSTVLELCRIVQSCWLILQKAFDALADGKPFIDHSIEINRLEEAADQLGRAAVKELFEKEKIRSASSSSKRSTNSSSRPRTIAKTSPTRSKTCR